MIYFLKKEQLYSFSAKLFLFTVFLYSCARSFILSITHDEALTVVYHASRSYFDIIANSGEIFLANNHLLSTVLVKFFISNLGFSEFVARIPALIGCALYLIGVYKILELFFNKNRPSFLLGVFLLASNPFLLDFFSLARGYSLALGFFILGLYYLLKRVASLDFKNRIRNTVFSLIMLTLSVLANLAFLNVYLAIVGLLVLLDIKDLIIIIRNKKLSFSIFKQLSLRTLLPIILSPLFLFTIYYSPVIKMKKLSSLYFGGTIGFWHDTVSSLVRFSLYGKNYFNLNLVLLFQYFIVALIIFSLILLIYKLLKKQKLTLLNKYLLIFGALLFLCALSIILQNKLFETKFVTGRAAIFFIPIFLIFALLVFKNVYTISLRNGRVIINFLLFCIALFSAVHFIRCANFTYAYVWKYDAFTKDVIKNIVVLHQDEMLQDKQITIGADWHFEPSINFYRIKYNTPWLRAVDRSGPDGKFDYYYLRDADILMLEKYNLALVNKFDLNNTYFAFSPAVANFLRDKINKIALSKDLPVNSKLLFTDQPEAFLTINMIPGILYNSVSFTRVFGAIFVALILLMVFLRRKSKSINENFNNIIIVFFAIFWTPLFINFFYNNIYDLSENLQYSKHDISGKRIIRLCNIDHRQNLGGTFCKLFSFITYSKNNLPQKTEVKLITSPSLNPYLHYYLYPYFTFNNNASNVLLYFSPDHYYEDSALYKKNKNDNIEIGQYIVVGNMGPGRLILKKSNE